MQVGIRSCTDSRSVSTQDSDSGYGVLFQYPEPFVNRGTLFVGDRT